jgi:hypothetical protein
MKPAGRFHMSQPDPLGGGPHTLLSGHLAAEPGDCLALSQGPSQRSFAGRGSQHNSLLLSQPLGGSQVCAVVHVRGVAVDNGAFTRCGHSLTPALLLLLVLHASQTGPQRGTVWCV